MVIIVTMLFPVSPVVYSRWPDFGFLLSLPREVSVIRAKKFHTDDINLPRISGIAPDWQSSLTVHCLKTSTVNSGLMLPAILTQTKIIMLIIVEYM